MISQVESQYFSHRTRQAVQNDMISIYNMGFDVWGDGYNSQESYLADCRASKKYSRGIWYVLEDHDGNLISSLIIYILNSIKGIPAYGIGSIATTPNRRCQGFAGQLIQDVMRRLNVNENHTFYLHSEIDSKYYERFDFIKLPEQYQKHPGSIVMIRSPKKTRESLLNDPHFLPPEYF